MVVPVSASAQELGVKAGINFASLTPEDDEDPDITRRRGPVGGIWVGMARADRLSFQAEGLFSEKGVKFNTRALEVDNDIDIRIRYVEIPLLARYDFGAPASATRLFVVGGAAPAFKLSARGRFAADGEEQTQDLEDDIKAFDLGLVAGAGVQFGLAAIEARYTHGITHINTDDNGDEDRIKNRVFSVTIGFRLR